MNLIDTDQHLVALITCPDTDSANKLADGLVGGNLAACVNIVAGLTSVYRWKGEICRDSELLLVVKTSPSKRAEITTLLETLHPYEEPELIFLPITSGSQSYLEWITKHTRSGGPSPK